MSDSPLVTLFKELLVQINAELPDLGTKRRYMPYIKAEELGDDIKVSLFLETNEDGKLGRSDVDTHLVTFGISVQQLVARPSDDDADGQPVLDGVDNLAHGDAVLNIVEQIKDLWRTGGALRERDIANYSFKEMVHDPIYEPIHLMSIGVFTSIIDVTYELTDN